MTETRTYAERRAAAVRSAALKPRVAEIMNDKRWRTTTDVGHLLASRYGVRATPKEIGSVCYQLAREGQLRSHKSGQMPAMYQIKAPQEVQP